MPDPRPLRDLWLSTWTAPGATPAEADRYRGRQCRAVLGQMPVACLGTQSLAWGALLLYWDAVDRRPMLLWVLALALFDAVSLALWWRSRRWPAERPVSAAGCWALALHIGASALPIAGMFEQVLLVSTEPQRLIAVAVGAGVIATGAWMFAPLPHAGLAWLAGICGGLILWPLSLPLPGLGPLATILAFYGVVLAGTTLVSARLFLSTLIAGQALKRQNRLVQLLLRDFEAHASDWLWEVGPQGRLRHVSPRLAQLLGAPEAALLGRDLLALLAERLPPDQPAAREQLDRLAQRLAGGREFRDHDLHLQLGGLPRWWSLSAKPLSDAVDGQAGWRGVGSDVTELREREQALRRLATEDTLTGLANRHQFNRCMHAAFLSPRPHTLLLLDLDNFKQVNDSLGHGAGDALLAELARRLRHHRWPHPDTLIARLGGDEFALLWPGAAGSAALQALGVALRECLAEPMTLEGRQLGMRASLGAARAPEHAASATALTRAADLALYAAKAAGGGQLREFEADMMQRADERLQLTADLRQALAQGQLQLHYQPVTELGNGAITSCEALLRWTHPQRGAVAPARFIPLAEDSGLIHEIGGWVLARACADAATWPGRLAVAVNVSAVEIARGGLEARVRAALQASGLAASRLEIELTESALVHEGAAAQLQALRSLGVRVALDDFGTGFSSLAYLRRLPLDKLKIDRAFVHDLGQGAGEETAQAIITTIHGLARALRLQVTAEGIETAGQRQTLQALGCELGQGFLIARPMPLAELQALLQTPGSNAVTE